VEANQPVRAGSLLNRVIPATVAPPSLEAEKQRQLRALEEQEAKESSMALASPNEILASLQQIGSDLWGALEGIEKKVVACQEGLRFIYAQLEEMKTKASAPPSPPANRGYAPRGAGGGGYGGGGYPPRQAPARPPVPKIDPADFPAADPNWFDSRHLEGVIQFGKHKGQRWGDLLNSQEGTGYLEWMVCGAISQEGPDPMRWQKGANARLALWCLQWGGGAAAPYQGEQPARDDVPF